MQIRPFQIGLIVIFALMGIVSIMMLANYKSAAKREAQAYGSGVTIWGTLDQKAVDSVLSNISSSDKAFAVVSYKQIDATSFYSTFLNAVADGKAPDMLILSSNDLVKYRSKLMAIPYKSLDMRTFRSTYIDGAEIFAMSDGIYALPFAVDPLIMYWNRDIFAAAGMAEPPKTWEEVVGSVVPKTTKYNSNNDITQSGLAFGDYRNIHRAEDVLLTLTLQSGSAMVTERTGGGYTVALNEPVDPNNQTKPLQSALQFYTNFSNPQNALYSWNRALPLDTNMFTAGQLALYFGRGSEAQSISDKNPNLNFDVAEVPQGKDTTIPRTFGAFYGFAFPLSSHNINGAFAVANVLSTATNEDHLTHALNMAPARRDLLASGSSEPFRAIILKSALVARGWLGPDQGTVDGIFQQMVEDVSSNRSRVTGAVSDALGRLSNVY